MSWEAFLRKVADENGLTPDQTKVFLVQFDEQHKSKSNDNIVTILGIEKELYKKLKTHYFKKFAAEKTGKYSALKSRRPHKDRILRELLEIEYSQQQPEPISDSSSSDAPCSDEWRNICRAKIESRQRLTSNLLMPDDSAKFAREQIYVPLALVQRTKPDRRDRTNVSPEAGTHLYEPQYEETQQFQHDDFLTRILQGGEGKTKGQRIALIGEPGAGKTTLLQAIASWVFSDKTGVVAAVDGSQKSEQSTALQDVAIWISLADLQGKTLEEYLLQTWLKEALEGVEAMPEKKTALGELFKSGRVWLLLDAVDEMGVGSPLVDIASQLKGWVAKARVVLTCRMNVWQANRNDLEAFETYRLLDFDYPDQVHRFIDKWFNREPNPLDLAQRLKDELAKTEQLRIRDLVQNPLRLALLCSTWKHWQGRLPETKAGLYEKFVQQFYIWKPTAFPTTLEQRQQLNAALGRLALRDIEAGVSRFRLTESFIQAELGHLADQGSLFFLALQLGWLNQVGVAAENPDEKVYAFFHPTFEEYFAALAIEDWHFCLNHVLHNPDAGSYHIFEPRWKEVILLWLGRTDVAKVQKEAFIQALVEFEDGCKDLYWFRAYFLAAIGISEFKECTIADEIVDQIVKWGFGYSNFKEQQWQPFLPIRAGAGYGSAGGSFCLLWEPFFPIQEGARATTPETDRSRAIAALVELFSPTTDEFIRWRAADGLGTTDPGNKTAIAALVELLSFTTRSYRRSQAAESLGTTDPGNKMAIAALVELLSFTTDESTYRSAASSLGRIAMGNETAIAALVERLSSTTNENVRRQAADSLGTIDPGNTIAIAALAELLSSTTDENVRRQAADSLGTIDPGNKTAIAALVELLSSTSSTIDRDTCREAADRGTTTIEALGELFSFLTDEYIRRQAAESLGTVDPGNKTAIAALVKLLSSTSNEFTRWRAADSLGTVDPGNKTAIAALVKLLSSTSDEFIRWRAADSLGTIDPGNKTAIAALVELLSSTTDKNVRWQAAESLGKIAIGNEKAIAALVELLSSTTDESTRHGAAESLGEIAIGNEKAIAALVELLSSTTDKDTHWRVANSLKKILRDEQFAGVVTALKDYLSDETYVTNFDLFDECYKVIWHCAQNLTYPEFYQAWHNPPITPHPEVAETTAVGSPSLEQSYLLAQLPYLVAAAISQDSQLTDQVKLICIDGSNFNDSPALDTYIEICNAGYPECEDGRPKTMSELKSYWKLDVQKCHSKPILLFYESHLTNSFSEAFLRDLSKFGDACIGVVTALPTNEEGESLSPISPWGSLQLFSPNQPNLVADIVGWIRKLIQEQ